MEEDKYIMFLGKQKGKDGYKYIQNVKYKIQRETIDAFYLIGHNGFMNKFLKSKLKDKFITGNVIRDWRYSM